jgi:hypothetical protein
MQMPETPMHEDALAKAGKHQVRLARQIAPVEPESKAKPVGESPHR